jgi:hypothetical protein
LLLLPLSPLLLLLRAIALAAVVRVDERGEETPVRASGERML